MRQTSPHREHVSEQWTGKERKSRQPGRVTREMAPREYCIEQLGLGHP